MTSDYQDQGSVGSSAEDDAHSLTFNADGSKLYITMSAAESNNTRKWVLEYDLDCPYGVVYCESPISGSDKDIIGTIEAYTEQSKRIVKNNLFEIPEVFKIIHRDTKSSLREMYQVFNMGHRMEIYCKKEASESIIKTSKEFNVDAKIIGYVEEASKNELIIDSEEGIIEY
mgnify:CR=1 FL=1